MKTFFKFMRGEDGATLIEYAIIAALIAMVAIATLRTVGTNLKTSLSGIVFS